MPEVAARWANAPRALKKNVFVWWLKAELGTEVDHNTHAVSEQTGGLQPTRQEPTRSFAGVFRGRRAEPRPMDFAEATCSFWSISSKSMTSFNLHFALAGYSVNLW